MGNRVNKETMTYKLGTDRAQSVHSSWHRGKDCNFQPSKKNLKEKGAIERYFLKGLVPSKPVISRKDRILAVGSCFAHAVVRYLRKKSLAVNRLSEGTSRGRCLPDLETNVGLLFFSGGFVTSVALLHHFEWALGKREIKGYTLYAEHPQSLHKRRRGPAHMRKLVQLPSDDRARRMTRDAITSADAYILTFGLSEAWYDKRTGDTFFKAVPEVHFDPKKHGFRQILSQENYENIYNLYKLIRRIKPTAPIVLTLSPVPLTATFRSVPCPVANAVSKASLRTAIDDVVSENILDKRLFYWPSYEIILDYYGRDAALKDDFRHVKEDVVGQVMQLFEKYFIA